MTSTQGRRPTGPGAYHYEDGVMAFDCLVTRHHDMRRLVALYIGPWNGKRVDRWEPVDDMPGDFVPLTKPVAAPVESLAEHILGMVVVDLKERIAELEAELAALRATTVAAPEPDWSKAPEKAKWHLYCADGTAWWSYMDREPKVDSEFLDSWHVGGSLHAAKTGPLPIGIDWRTTLRRRPEVQSE